jgi:hypothetical protein
MIENGQESPLLQNDRLSSFSAEKKAQPPVRIEPRSLQSTDGLKSKKVTILVLHFSP